MKTAGEGAAEIALVLLVICLLFFLFYIARDSYQEEIAETCRVAQDNRLSHHNCESVDIIKRIARQRKEIDKIRREEKYSQ